METLLIIVYLQSVFSPWCEGTRFTTNLSLPPPKKTTR